MGEIRVRVELGSLRLASAIRWYIQPLPLDVRTAIAGYLEGPGVVMERAWPPGWFHWLDAPVKSVFISRCSDPPTVWSEYRDQPWNFFVEAEIIGGLGASSSGQRAIATDFYHESKLQSLP